MENWNEKTEPLSEAVQRGWVDGEHFNLSVTNRCHLARVAFGMFLAHVERGTLKDDDAAEYGSTFMRAAAHGAAGDSRSAALRRFTHLLAFCVCLLLALGCSSSTEPVQVEAGALSVPCDGMALSDVQWFTPCVEGPRCEFAGPPPFHAVSLGSPGVEQVCTCLGNDSYLCHGLP